MKKIAYLLSALSLLAAGFLAGSCEKAAMTDPGHLIYFGITAPYARVGGISFTINQITHEITNTDPIPAGMDLTGVKPYFVTNDAAAEVFVKGTRQESGVTRQDLSGPVEYEVVSGASSVKYTVTLTQSAFAQTQVAVKLMKQSPLLMNEIEEEKETWLSEDARLTEVVFKTADGYNWRLSVIEADLAAGRLGVRPLVSGGLASAPADGAEWPVSTTLAQAQAAESAGVKVLAAVSGDEQVSGTNAPSGAMMMDGTSWKTAFSGEANGFFGLRKDGRLSVGTAANYLTVLEKLEQAIGGGPVLLLDGQASSSLEKTSRANRVAAGTNTYDLQTLYLISLEAVGGSAGPTLPEAAEILLDLGAGHAVCLQGGAKAAFVVKDGGALRVTNRSEADLTAVTNSLALIVK